MPETAGWQKALDTAADRLIVPGYSRFGYDMRRRWWPPDAPPDILAGETVLVTGANSGLGEATTAGLARLGAFVRMVVRDRERGEVARDRIIAHAGIPANRLTLDICDISDLDAVRKFGLDFRSRCGRLRVLVHNAGVMPPERRESAQGHELSLATHVLGPHLLTELLSDTVAAANSGRIIWVSSGGMYAQRLPREDWEYEDGHYHPGTAYARTKRMQVVLAKQWAERLRGRSVVVHAMHPGWADTDGVRTSMPRFHRATGPLLRTPTQGADTVVWLAGAAEPGRTTGLFWQDRRPRPTHYGLSARETRADRARLWAMCQRATAAVATSHIGQ